MVEEHFKQGKNICKCLEMGRSLEHWKDQKEDRISRRKRGKEDERDENGEVSRSQVTWDLVVAVLRFLALL